MMKAATRSYISRLALAVGCMAAANAAQAQPDPVPAAPPAAPQPRVIAAQANGDEIVVTARRRDETSIAVPVSVTAIGPAQIENLGIASVRDVARLAPGLIVGEASSGMGGTIALRGVGTTGNNPTFDQTVSINIDGVQISRGNALRIGQIDMNSIEILRGPQALFFGKNSPAGIVTIRTADPTDEFDSLVRATYDPIARGISGEAVISGPLSPWLRVRLVGFHSEADGYFINDAYKGLPANAIVPGAVHATRGSRGPASNFDFGRATVIIEPSQNFIIRAKYSYAHNEADALTYGSFQRVWCEGGVPQIPLQLAALGNAPGLQPLLAVDDCHGDNHFTQGDLNPALQSGVVPPFARQRGLGESLLHLASLEANYDVTPNIRLTSVSGYVALNDIIAGPFTYGPADATVAAWFLQPFRYHAFTQEARVVTSLPDSPVNGVVGLLFEDAHAISGSVRAPLATSPVFTYDIYGKTISPYVQLLANLGNFEIAGGVRYTRESKDLVVSRSPTSTSPGVVQPIGVPRGVFSNWSPELTLTYRPTQTFTAYAAYRQGFKSGGFAATLSSGSPANAAVGLNALYGPETVWGTEVGAKLALDGGRLRVNVAGYYSHYSDLQVSSLDNSTGTPVIRVLNAATAKVQGIEADFNWRLAGVPGLTINGAAAFNDATFNDFIAPCFLGQTVAEGCNLNVNPATGRFREHDRSGQQLNNAPRWTALLGSSYEFPINASGLRAGVTASAAYKSRYNPHPDGIPWAAEPPSFLLNAAVRLFDNRRGWEVALIGNNLTDIYRGTLGSNLPFAGNAATTGSTTPGGHSDLTSNVSRGREILLRLTLRPSRW